ncbi:hypothetical protein MRS44_001094 [Fusarium solani]|uniref:uncharacterized protein n=1 Tax=Fusarium solani TaxID=169388 RepID=UPI0032C3EA79|nr:hypothetical protein MRS44_001094 [Fusarium solani]
MFSRCCIALVALRVATAQLIIDPSSSTLDEPSETAVLSGGILLETVVSQPPPALSFTDSFDPETTDGVVSESETAVPTTTSEEKLLVDTSVPPVLPGLASSDAAESSSISETDSIRSPSSPSSFTPTADGRIVSTPRPVATPTAILTPGNGTFTGIRNSTRTEAGASTTVLPSSGSGGSGSGSGGNVKEGSKNNDKDEDDEDNEDSDDDDDEDDEDSDDEDEDEDEDEEEEEDEEEGGSSSSDSDSADATTFTSVTRAGATAVAESASAGEDPSAAHHTSPGALLCLSVLVMGAAILV